MLISLHIKNFALIDEVVIDFSPGLNVITGETGSGKSVVMQALQLVLGARADGVSFFDPQRKCIIELHVKIDREYTYWFKDHDIDYFEDCVIRRELVYQSKSRLFINDTPITQAALHLLTEQVLSFHSQHESYSFLRTNEQFQLLDDFSDNQEVLTRYNQTYREFKRLSNELDILRKKADTFEREWAYQKHLKEELDLLQLDRIDQEFLEQQHELFSQSEKIIDLITEANQLFDSEPYGTLEQLRSTLRLLSELQRISPKFAHFFERLQSVVVEVQDLSVELQQALDSVNIDPDTYQEIEQKLSELHRLQTKHGVVTLEALIEKRDALAASLGEDQSYQERVQSIEKQVIALEAELRPLSAHLSSKRKEAAIRLSSQIQEVLSSLEMPAAQLRIEVAHKSELMINGSDEVLFKFQANKGAELLDLKQVISGGELSRLALAIQYVKGKSKAIPTQVFDEIDTGVSGQVAERVAQLFDLIGARHQLLVITHLPQVAAKGHAHLKIFKSEVAGRFVTSVKKLNASDREYEIASMIEGNDPSETALSHARTLLSKR